MTEDQRGDGLGQRRSGGEGASSRPTLVQRIVAVAAMLLIVVGGSSILRTEEIPPPWRLAYGGLLLIALVDAALFFQGKERVLDRVLGFFKRHR